MGRTTYCLHEGSSLVEGDEQLDWHNGQAHVQYCHSCAAPKTLMPFEHNNIGSYCSASNTTYEVYSICTMWNCGKYLYLCDLS